MFDKKYKMVSKLMNDLEKNYDVELFLHHNKYNTIILSKIEVPKKLRNNGIGSKVMREICDFADKNSMNIALTPANDFGGSLTRLKKFYKYFDFVKYKGYNFMEKLIRYPQN